MNISHFGLRRQTMNLKDELLDATHLAIKDGVFINGPYTRKFEEWLKVKTNARYVITVHSGTQALNIIARYVLSRYNLPRYHGRIDNTISIPNFTYPATLNAFLDAKYDVELLDTDQYGIMRKEEGTKHNTVCLVGLYGRAPWTDHTNWNNIIVDGAQHWLVADGNIGVGMAISFDPTKNLPCSGNGGAIVTNEFDLYYYATKFKQNGKNIESQFDTIGTNSKLSEIDAAHLLVRSKYIDMWQQRRKDIATYWYNIFKELPILLFNDNNVPHANQKFVIYTENRNSLHTHLLTENIESRIHYEYTLGDLPIAAGLNKPDLLSTSVMLSKGVLSLPIYPELTDTEVEYIGEKVLDFYR